MPLITYYNAVARDKFVGTESPIYNTHKFTLKIPETSLVGSEVNKNNVLEIHGIVNELPEISYSTSWDIGPISVISKKVEEFTNHKLFKAFAQNNEQFRPPVITDGWTQQMPKSAEPLKFNLEFRSYPIDEFYNTTVFTKIIKFLIFASTPKRYEFADSIKYTGAAMEHSYNTGEELGKAIQDATKAFKGVNMSSVLCKYADLESGKKVKDLESNSKEKGAIDALKKVFTVIESISNMIKTDVGGAPLCLFSLGNKDKNNSGNMIINEIDSIKWMIRDWSFKPALNVTYNDRLKKYAPIYVDFKVSLESQMIFTASEMRQILNGR